MSEEVKPGSKTSEFWTVIVSMVGLLAPLAWAMVDKNPTVAAVVGGIIAFLSLGYAFCRTWIKKEESGEIDILNPEWQAKFKDALDRIQEIAHAAGKPLGVLLLCFLLLGSAGCSADLVAREAVRADRGLDNAIANRESLIETLQQTQAIVNGQAAKLLAEAVKAAPDKTGELIEVEMASREKQRLAIADFRQKDDLNLQEVRNCHARMVRAASLFGSKTDVAARLDSLEALILKIAERK